MLMKIVEMFLMMKIPIVMKMMLNEIKQMTVNLLLTFIQTDEAGQRDIYKCPRIRLTMSTRRINMMMNRMIMLSLF